MQTPWIEARQLARAQERNEAFWAGTLDDGPLLWLSAPNARPGAVPPEPDSEDALWTDVDYVIAAAESGLARTHYAGDALPVYTPWLGPDQFAAWLGADMALKPREFTSWITPFVTDWEEHPALCIRPENRWWKLYLALLRRAAEAGKDKWVTGYPDLHCGIDALSAIRGPENLAMDLLTRPDAVHRAMAQMTELATRVINTASNILLPFGQGTSNWTMGWSAKRFFCVGQNDFTCMISPEAFNAFCLQDTLSACRHVDYSLYHLDGPDAIRHVPALLSIEELTCIQWIQGAGAPLPSAWIPLLRQIQDAGKSVQVYYGPSHGASADLRAELEVLCEQLDPARLFFWAIVDSAEEADSLVRHARALAAARRPAQAHFGSNKSTAAQRPRHDGMRKP